MIRTAVLVLAVCVALAVGVARWQAPTGAAPSAGSIHQSQASLVWDDDKQQAVPADDIAIDGSVSTLAMRSADALLIADDAARPSRVLVPSLQLDVDIVPVGVDEEGLLDVPSADQVGWYQYGPTPAAAGSAVLAAHVDYNGDVGAFFDLKDLTPGDLVHLEYDDGSSRSFKVVDQVLYEKNALPADELFRRGGNPVLRLATCGGSFDPVSRSYLGNRVVTAIPVSELPEFGAGG